MSFRWFAVAAIALLAGAKTFAESAQSALLDMGATLFVTVAMISCWLAQKYGDTLEPVRST